MSNDIERKLTLGVLWEYGGSGSVLDGITSVSLLKITYRAPV